MSAQTKSNSFLQSNLALIAAVAFLVVGASMIFSNIFATKASPNPTAAAPSEPSSLLSSGVDVADASGYTDNLISTAQAHVKQYPQDFQGYSDLGLAYLQKARETNDPTLYTQAEGVLKQGLAINPDDYNALSGMGSLEMSRHQFRDALQWGGKASQVNPYKSYAYGVMGDAHIELGEYDQAVASFQKMLDTRPDLSSYSRVSYARELHGDIPGAIEAMQQAIAAGSPAAENTSWCRVQLGNLYFNSNQIDKAEYEYNEALADYPDYLHALAGLAQVRWAQGRTADAIDLYKRATNIVPLPQYLQPLGDLYTDTGDTAKAKEQYDLVDYIWHVFETNGVNVNIEKALFLADRNTSIPEAVTLAEQAESQRSDVNTENSIAWVFYRAGRYQDALDMEKKAMRLNSQNALFYFHMGMIYDKLGDHDNARQNLQKALDINPHFNILYAKEASDTLAQLGK